LGSDIDGESEGDYSGKSVSLSSDGSTIAIGAPFGYIGQVRVYSYDSGSSTWIQMGSGIDEESPYDSSGYSVSLSSDGSTVAIGAPTNDGNGPDSGHVRIYNYDSGSSTWIQVGSDIDGESEYDRSGQSVSLSSDGSTVAIGANRNDGNGRDSGHVRIYNFNSISETWVQLGTDIDGEYPEDSSGGSVSLSSDGLTVAIGAPLNDENGTNSGHVKVYNFDSGSSTWIQMGSNIDGKYQGNISGNSVSLNSDGSTVAIGAPGVRSGQVRVYNFNSGSSTWTQMGPDIDGEFQGDRSGTSVSLSSEGSTVAIGAIFNDENGFESGHVRTYSLEFDTDGDGVLDTADAFPLDSSESVDTDGDGTGNNADTDDDGDGVLDTVDSFPLDPTRSQSRGSIVNVSARVTLGSGGMVTPGFVVRDAPTKLLIRAVGPRLGDFDVDYLPNPRMTIFDGSQNVVRAIDDWTYDNSVSELSDIANATAAAGAFPLAQDTASAATLVTLDPGAYTVQVDSADEGVGDVLVEVYEISE
jgi:hypothetical protein